MDIPERAQRVAPDTAGDPIAVHPDRSKNTITIRTVNEVARRVQRLLEDDSLYAIYKLTHMFGPELVERKAAEALDVWQAAHEKGGEAYAPSQTLVAKADGTPRTRGGVFFQVMRRHCQSIGLNWYGIFPPPGQKLPDGQNAETPAPKGVEPHPEEKKTYPKKSKETSAPPQSPAPGAPPSLQQSPSPSAQSSITPQDMPPKPKPSRCKVTVTGTLVAAPKRDAEKGLIELTFQTEMTANPSKRATPSWHKSGRCHLYGQAVREVGRDHAGNATDLLSHRR